MSTPRPQIPNQSVPPPEPTMTEGDNPLPQTTTTGEDTGSPTQRAANNNPCVPRLGPGGEPVLTGPASLAWGKIHGGPRVHLRPFSDTSSYRQYGTAKLQAFISGLSQVPGGEEIGNQSNMQGDDPPAGGFKPGWYIGDCSRKVPGPVPGHVSHQSGIGFDLSIPRVERDEQGRVTSRGMSIRYSDRNRGRWAFTYRGLVYERKSSSPRTQRDQQLLEYGFNVDWTATMAFLLYAVPWCSSPGGSIFWYQPHIDYAHNLAKQFVQNNVPGWTEEVRKKLFENEPGRRKIARHSGCRGGSGYVCHASHFHVRLTKPGLFDDNGDEKIKDRELSKYGAQIQAMGGWDSQQERQFRKNSRGTPYG